MEGKKRRRFANRVIIITSDAENAGVKRIRLKPWVFALVVLFICAMFGALLGYLFYEEKVWQEAMDRSNMQLQAMEKLQFEKTQAQLDLEARELELSDKIADLQNEKQILSQTLNQNMQQLEQLQKELDKFYIPTSFPLNGSASPMEITEDDPPVAKIATSVGVMVVATAKGTVIAVNDDLEYGHNVWIDHGNGYITIYRNQGKPLVEQGDIVFQGTALYLIERKNTTLGYQIMIDGKYVNPAEVIDIKG